MKYALISDIHANLSALEAVLNDIKMQNCSNVACLGDIVGYYNEPKECVGIIRDMKIPCVRGNFDECCSSQTPLTDFNPKAAAMIEWTRQQLNDEDRAWLRGLPEVLTIAGFTIVHSTMDEPHRLEYIFDNSAAGRSFIAQRTPLCFFGHTHVPVVFVRDATIHGGTYTKFKIEPKKQYFVNVGSVGQPRDGNSKAAYVIYDLEEKTVELRRVEFPNLPGSSGSELIPLQPNSPKPKPFTGARSNE